MIVSAAALRAELPRLRRYAHGTIGSTELGDRCIADCLTRIADNPNVMPDARTVDLALFRFFHQASGNIEAASADEERSKASRDRAGRIWRALPHLPLGERQALMLVSVDGLSVVDAGYVLGLDPRIVRDRIARAERALLKRTAASVMIIEDEFLLAADLSRMVNEMGHEVCGAASDHAEAVAMAERFRPNLVLADLRLRGGDSGQAAIQEIRRHLDTEVIYVTAHAEQLDPRRRPEFPVIQKPVQSEQLVQAVGQALARACA